MLGSLFRCYIFFAMNLGAGLDSAIGAMLTELVFRGLTSGWWGSITQAIRRVHWLRGTPRLAASIAGSIAFVAAEGRPLPEQQAAERP